MTIIPTKTNAPTIAPTKTISPTIDPSDTPKPIPTKIVALLPGLQPADVTVNPEQRGLTCGSVERGLNYYIRSCKKETSNIVLNVEIYGRQAISVDYIDATILQFSNPSYNTAAAFLGFVATVPYDGAQAQDAQNWVKTTLPTLKGQGDERVKVFEAYLFICLAFQQQEP